VPPGLIEFDAVDIVLGCDSRTKSVIIAYIG
jgi:hypothetical protein